MHRTIQLLIAGFAIILSSLIFLEYKKIDHTNDLEAYQIAKLIDDRIDGINSNTNAANFLKVAQFSEQWSVTKINNDWEQWRNEFENKSFLCH